MKYLDARKADGKEESKSILPKDVENKMRQGSRSDQQDGRPPISGVRRETNTDTTKSKTSTPSKAVTDLAGELGVDLATVKGTGKDGAVTEQDVRNAKLDK